ncbi:MAG: hypothetical protein COU82_00420 [Candidatus Portnoybacteria bacterium CG10_big_fil_rev_8_21_14_0_10_38_18]|uniref:Uncharacterized protein n=1 Tax=Candidatus Portnoybacteria bacterium CG10_big_fil_rev_8_21_14_0_10_38_18 TaxID=1974813 RepID=A0A2M8KCR9_9BACT|nr:MAG: hypothetical protein COU82_00420 [Candidatus Portnoybacteria bacterium CG10_big_fil_rev_8_21_14_0_10_38_18]
MKIEEFIEILKTNPGLREELFYRPEETAKKYGLLLRKEQLEKFKKAKELEEDPLLKACMCPITIGTTDKQEDFIRYEKKDPITAK